MSSITCKSCGGPVTSQMIACPNCGTLVGYAGGTTVERPAPAVAPAAGPAEQATSSCKSCGSPVTSQDSFCPNCGTPVGYQGGTPHVPTETFSDNRTRAALAIAGLCAVIVILILVISSSLKEIDFVNRISGVEGRIGRGERLTPAEATSILAAATANDDRETTIAWVYIGGYIGAGVVYLFWIHRAYKNLLAFNVPGLNYSPGWAVGGFLVPFLNLWRPYQVIREIWRGSGTSALDRSTAFAEYGPLHPVIGIWWGLWIVSGYIAYRVLKLIEPGETDLNGLKRFDQVLIAVHSVEIIAAVLAVVVVFLITARQVQTNLAREQGGRGL
jgi:RNA polymerase subunit RPABC4/transcription elongation factor Spt4